MGPCIQDVSFLIFVILTCMSTADTDFSIIVPSQPVDVYEGDDVILPCRLSPQNNAARMHVIWFRLGQFSSPLYDFDNGRVTVGQDYLGRVNMSTQGLEKGDVSLGLKGVLLADRGEYRCQVIHQEWIKEQAIEVQVKKIGSVPTVSLVWHHKTFIQLSCSSEFWYPEPHMLWLDHRGQEVTSAQTEEARQSGDLFSISSRVKLGKERLQGISCVAMSHDRKYRLESAMEMTEEFYLNSGLDRAYLSAYLIPTFLALVFVCASVVYAVHQTSEAEKKLQPLYEAEAKLKKKREENKINQDELEKKKKIIEITNKIPESVWGLMLEHAEDITLDPDTAHPGLRLSDDNRSVSFQGSPLKQLTKHKRFLEAQCVLGEKGYTSGRHYWEVDLGNNTQWSVGVAQDPENRGSDISTRPDNGYWRIRFEDGMLQTEREVLQTEREVLQTVEEPHAVLPSELTPATLGVFLDIENQRVTFFNVEKRYHIHSFSFSERSTKELFPFFGPLAGCKNELRIVPVERKGY
ncbi:butyrophilin subfamily 1 member A1-like [Hypomesus transpacificus]|uniref:butyrophilin subfamily 1 member A1-like n=1 Tax=Hypomesus transpacificus TaxID=137520 RepID=UPI001F07CBF7|nr:butyrophilin subfamily 1 member A1-like [Hypomesus transpacificus]